MPFTFLHLAHSAGTGSMVMMPTTMMVLPFDAHNHVHMGPTLPLQALLQEPSCLALPAQPLRRAHLA